MLTVRAGHTAAVKFLRPRKIGDSRGFFSETYNRRALEEHGIHIEFVQDNHSFSREPGVLRGLHFQTPPFAQHKLVRVLRGRIFDVAVDLRRGSPTYGQHDCIELDAEAGEQILVPIGFAHGVLTLEPETEIAYKVSNYYTPQHDRGLHWADPALKIAWPLAALGAAEPILSDKDRAQPTLAEISATLPFQYSAEDGEKGALR